MTYILGKERVSVFHIGNQCKNDKDLLDISFIYLDLMYNNQKFYIYNCRKCMMN